MYVVTKSEHMTVWCFLKWAGSLKGRRALSRLLLSLLLLSRNGRSRPTLFVSSLNHLQNLVNLLSSFFQIDENVLGRHLKNSCFEWKVTTKENWFGRQQLKIINTSYWEVRLLQSDVDDRNWLDLLSFWRWMFLLQIFSTPTHNSLFSLSIMFLKCRICNQYSDFLIFSSDPGWVVMRQCKFKAKVKFALKKISKAVQCQRDNLQEFEIQNMISGI